MVTTAPDPALEWYPTPPPLTQLLFDTVDIQGTVADFCCGDGAIQQAAPQDDTRAWVTNDLDPYWEADLHGDATSPSPYSIVGPVDWHVTNPPFGCWVEIAEQMIRHATGGVALHLRASCHEVTKTGVRRTWMAKHPPTGLIWLPRFAYQRSKKTGEWASDTVTCCWVIWLKGSTSQWITYAPESTLNALKLYSNSRDK